jgi:putative ABC transport system substrate-binding protein
MNGLSAELDAIWLRPDPALISPTLLQALALVSLEKRIPLLAFAPKYLEYGAAMAIYSSPEQLGQQAADLVKRLLRDPSAEATLPEDGREVTVLTNERIIQNLGLTFKPLTTHEGQEAP